MIHGPGQAGPWIDRWLKSGFEKRYEARLGLRKIDEMPQRVASRR